MKRVFLSFLAEDRQQVDGLRLLAANPEFDLDFYDESVRDAIDSGNAAYIKQRIRERINRTSVTVCLISPGTHLSKWVDWELEVSADKGNALVAMALKGVNSAVLPRLLRDQSARFHAWDPTGLGTLLREL